MSAKDHLKGLAEELGVVSKIIIALGVIGGAMLSVNGVVSAVREAPETMASNAARLEVVDTAITGIRRQAAAHDTAIGEHDQVIVAIPEMLDAVKSLQTQNDFLICDRGRRRAELAGIPWQRDCEEELLIANRE